MSKTWATRRREIFNSVFVNNGVQNSAPALPVRTSPRKQVAHSTVRGDPVAADQRRWAIAWHATTAVLALPSYLEPGVEVMINDDFSQAICIVINPATEAPKAPLTDDLMTWFMRQVHRHYVQHVKAALKPQEHGEHTIKYLMGFAATMETAIGLYSSRMRIITSAYAEFVSTKKSKEVHKRYRRELHGLISNSTPETYYDAMNKVLTSLMTQIVSDGADHVAVSPSKAQLIQVITAMRNIGLGGRRFELMVASAVNGLLQDYVINILGDRFAQEPEMVQIPDAAAPNKRHISVPRNVAALFNWVEREFAPLVAEIMDVLGQAINWTHVMAWKELALGILAKKRIDQLFDIVSIWPRSRSGLQDLKTCVTTTTQRSLLTDAFSRDLEKKLLHPGSSTLRILRFYISMIRTFHALDNSKVLLDRVVPALQLYLCQRDDAIRNVVTGLLSLPSEADTPDAANKLVELSVILNSTAQSKRMAIDDEDQDWDDMSWLPAPIDAAINFKRPRTEDVIGTLISALGSQEMFIKEFQAIVAQRLLSVTSDLDQEIKVLNLLKKRYGDMALQHCDVMMRDVAESQALDEQVRSAAHFTSSAGLTCSANILSRLYWPNLVREHFLIPGPVAAAQERYSEHYAQIKAARKLTWLDHMGSATVELELEDRTVRTTCKTYVATVIYAFGEDSGAAVQMSVDELEMKLQMDRDYIEEAVAFWVNQKVLRRVSEDVYAVIESEDSVSAPASNVAAAVGAVTSNIDSPSRQAPDGKKATAKDHEKSGVYWQFIVGMLKNSPTAMPLMRIAMMLRMVVPGGFEWTDEEVQEFMAEKVEEGLVELMAGKYKLAKR
ncbi:hypothetical protein TD95_001182 [Thielaviopsis punctulata]|uniref:Anaphase-promoting complex subunit 2 n=1 Tax=Thielaviopsis punctulata TaxID=72032 RepID=A0A0F4ZJ14_9PEZI|nr:hypothetical protein TD95_001182 [Thielaviopsis punctulata]